MSTLLMASLLVILAAPTLAQTTQSDIARLAILQPSSASNPRSPFAKLAQGIANHPKTQTVTFNISRDSDITEVRNWLKTQQYDAILALGRRSYQLAHQLKEQQADIHQPIIAGGVSLNPNGISGISLSGDPRQFFKRLKELAPKTRNVSIVYSEQMNGWWVHIAEAAAKDYQLTLKRYPADNIRDAVRQYKAMLLESEPITDAIWIPLIDLAPTKTVLPVVLKTAWAKRLPVFSNNPLHTKQGVLFSLYPNNTSMGEHLAEVAIEAISQPDNPQVKLSSDLKIAFNRRTAAHLGLKVSPSQLRSFDRVYPLK